MTTITEPVLNLSNASDSGEVEDGITNDATPTFNGFADPNAAVRIFDGATQIAQVTAGSDGTFSVTLPTLADGEHRLTATATVGGDTSAPSEALVLTIDTQAPTVSFTQDYAGYALSRLTITFSEAPVGFTVGDLSVSALTASLRDFSATADPRVFTVDVRTFRPFESASIRLDDGLFTDAAGNSGLGGRIFAETGFAPPSEPVTETVVDGVPVGKVVRQTGSGTEETLEIPVGRSGDSGRPLEIPAGGGQVLLPSGIGGTLSSLSGALSQVQMLNFLAQQAFDAAMQISASNQMLEAIADSITNAAQQSFNAFALQLGMSPLASSLAPVVIQGPLNQLSAFFLDATGSLPGTQVALQNINYALVTGQVNLIGGLGKQTVFADGAAQNMVLGEDDDELHGGGGNDTVGSASGDDRLFGDDGDDRVFGGTGDDFLHGNEGADTISGDEGGDILQGGKGDDVLSGGEGDDLLLGDLGNDTLTGGAGADVFVALVRGGRDIVADFNAAEGDRVQLSSGQRYTAHQAGADTVIDLDGGGELVLANVQLSALPAGWIV
ncbi:Ig-like domain-containing protein [Phenylobacterium sp.]|uniref:Ig-like domain-containing protein n=1 Tax=Phenylobacterium sp. TaxID=1871053 RepID=UPI0035B4BC19